MKKALILLTCILFLFAFAGTALAEETTQDNERPVPTLYTAVNDVVCTEEAKLCSDGSYVSRNSNNGCEFDECPSENCICPQGYIAEGNACNPKCYYNTPPCMMPSIECKIVNNETEKPLLGASCGTVTPGYQNECCERRGFDRWDNEQFKCIEENEDDNETEIEDEEENEIEDGVVCAMDVKICPDGTEVGRTGDNCEFKCPRQYNISREKVCCKVYGYGSEMQEVNVRYKITDKNECSIPRNFVGGNREIVENSYCIQQIKENREEFQEKKWEIMQERNRIKSEYRNQSECPDNCSCSGSTVKCSFENGTRVMTITAGKSGNVIVQVKDLNASTNVTLYKADGKVYGVFKNNETHVIILPDEARERIKEMQQDRKERKINLTNENITLGEDGYYHIDAKKKARLIWIVQVREHMVAQVDSETGEVVKIRNPWWGFLARDARENYQD